MAADITSSPVHWVEKAVLQGTALPGRAHADQAAVPTTAPTNSSPYGFSEAQATAIITLLNRLRADLVAVGIIKGSA